MLQRFLILFVIFYTTLAYGQKITVQGTVYDADGDPAYGVWVYAQNAKEKKVRTNRKGYFSVVIDTQLSDSIFFRSVAFEPYNLSIQKRAIKKALKNKGVLKTSIYLNDPTLNIFTVTPALPDTIVGTQAYSVEDFEFLPSGKIIVLTYEKNLRSGSVLRLLDQDKQELDRYYISDQAIELSKDYRGNIHLITEERVFFVKVLADDFRVYDENRDYYFKYVAPVIDSIGNNIYFSNYSAVYPAFDYYEFNTQDSTYQVILEVEDTFMMEFYRAEFKYVDVRTKIWAHNKQLETGIDKEIWVGATVFTNSIYYNPVYAPLFKTGADTIVVFDHYKNRMYRYRPEEGFLDSTRISYHLQDRKSGWEQPLLHDKETGKVYAMFQKSGYTYLSEIDKQGGHVKKSFKLHYKYADRIQIIGGEVFYIYRPFESIQKKYLYREMLRET